MGLPNGDKSVRDADNPSTKQELARRQVPDGHAPPIGCKRKRTTVASMSTTATTTSTTPSSQQGSNSACILAMRQVPRPLLGPSTSADRWTDARQ